MATSEIVVSTSTLIIKTLTTTFSTLYSTWTSVSVMTVTSILSELNTFHHLTTITQPATVIASTMAVPLTVTQTISSFITSTPYQPPPATVLISTVTSTIVEPGQTITWYPPQLPPTTTTVSFTTAYTPTSSTIPTVTATEIAFVLENTAGVPYSTITTTLPVYPTQSGPLVFVPGSAHGWDSWSAAQKGGLVAGVVLIGLIILGIVLYCLLRRRTIWLASQWAPSGQPQMIHTTNYVVPQGYWSAGHAGWGMRGGDGKRGWWKRIKLMLQGGH